jgi:hypothetical protein
MRLLSRLLIILVVCLAAISLPSMSAQAHGGASIWLSPTHGVPGEEITVYGDNFTADGWVDIYYYQNGSRIHIAEAEADDDGDFQVDFEVPESYAGDHEVFAEDEDDNDKYDYYYFTVQPGLIIDLEEGPVGTTVRVEGHGFAEDEENIALMYYRDSDPEIIDDDITADEDGYWARSFEIPDSAQGDHKIDAEGDESSLSEVEDTHFEVIPAIAIGESSGSVGDEVTMTGSGFYADDSYIKILVAGEEARTEPEIIRSDENGNWEANFEVPELPSGTYSITAEGESTHKEDITALSFEIGPGLVLSPYEGHVGTNLTVTGGGFTPDESVGIKYNGVEVKTTRTNDEGSFEVTFPVPESKYGARQVTAEIDGETEAIAIFIMESDPPDTPELVSPADGARVGFIGSVKPTFEWSEVFDESGVYYSLQIATNANFSATEGFAHPIVTVSNIVGTNYTLANTEALPYGTYYWIVQAVDGAENESGWTAARSFRVGAMPLWAFIVIMVAVAAGIGAAIYFRVIRNRIYYY